SISSGAKSVSAVPSRTDPWRLLDPETKASASTKVVFPLAPCPTTATLRISELLYSRMVGSSAVGPLTATGDAGSDHGDGAPGSSRSRSPSFAMLATVPGRSKGARRFLEDANARCPAEQPTELVDRRVDQMKFGWTRDGARRFALVADAREEDRLAALRCERAAGTPEPARVILEQTLDPGGAACRSAPR